MPGLIDRLKANSTRNAINIFHILIVSTLLYTLGTNKFPERYKQYLVYLSFMVAVYHFYRIYERTK